MSIRARLGHRLSAAIAALALGGLLASAGCGDDPYQTSCSVDDDCVVVPTAPFCGGCITCGRTTINRSDQDRYMADLEEVDCDQSPVSCGGTCDEPFAACADGNCALR